MTRLFLDTNIVVDLLERRVPFCNDAEIIRDRFNDTEMQ